MVALSLIWYAGLSEIKPNSPQIGIPNPNADQPKDWYFKPNCLNPHPDVNETNNYVEKV